MKIIYKSSTNRQFRTIEDYKLRVDSTKNLIQWTIYAHAPKDMHFKAADQYGLGGEHYIAEQSFEDFYTNPKYDIDHIGKEFIDLIIQDSELNKEVSAKMRALATSHEITLTRKDYTSLVLYEITIDDFSFNISCSDKKDIAKLDLLSHTLKTLKHEKKD